MPARAEGDACNLTWMGCGCLRPQESDACKGRGRCLQPHLDGVWVPAPTRERCLQGQREMPATSPGWGVDACAHKIAMPARAQGDACNLTWMGCGCLRPQESDACKGSVKS